MIDFFKDTNLEPSKVNDFEIKPIIATPVGNVVPDITEVKKYLTDTFRQKFEQEMMAAEKLKIEDELSEQIAVARMAQIKKLLKTLDDERSFIVAKPSQFVSDVNGVARLLKSMVDPILQLLKTKCENYRWKKEIERRERERILQDEARKLEESITKEAKDLGIEMPKIEIAVPVEKPKTVVQTNSGSAYTKTVWDYEVTDFSSCPMNIRLKIQNRLKPQLRQA